ncbi:hypothetical protein ADK59_25810 [Streptomyces sp. XY332]|nr:hypothetical protein ADK59_25810 [Streptomyces sp. XY332]
MPSIRTPSRTSTHECAWPRRTLGVHAVGPHVDEVAVGQVAGLEGGVVVAPLPGQPGPGGRLLLLLEPLADVVAVHQHAGCDVGQLAVGVDQVCQDAVVALPVQGPWADPVLVDRGELRGPGRGGVLVLTESVLRALVPELAMYCPTGTISSFDFHDGGRRAGSLGLQHPEQE